MGFFTGVNISSDLGNDPAKKNPLSDDSAIMETMDPYAEEEDVEDILGKAMMEGFSEGFSEEYPEDMDEDDTDMDEEMETDEEAEGIEMPVLSKPPVAVTIPKETTAVSPASLEKDEKKEPEKKIPEMPVQSVSAVSEKKHTLEGKNMAETVIGKDCVIKGSIECDGVVVIHGKVLGSVCGTQGVIVHKTGSVESQVSSTGSVQICGNVSGSISGKSVTLENTRVTGDITSEEGLTIGKGAVIVGDITAPSLLVKGGAIKGNIDVNGDVYIQKGSVIKGNITSSTIGMEPGVVVDGVCRQSYNSVDMDALFGGDSN